MDDIAVELRDKARRTGAKVIFFAAADRAYIDLYARLYVKSILAYCDVPFLIVLHVIGGKKDLRATSQSLGLSDERLLLVGDDRAIDSITNKSVDSPPKGTSSKPIAHLQSVRFLEVPKLLHATGLPIFVSDIDLILQRGVADLLARHAQDDFVLNENAMNDNAGSRLTANLLLLRPAAATFGFLKDLATYLTHALAQQEVTRWIDQFGLFFARRKAQAASTEVRIGYFDTSSDINNVIYTSYQTHPFRFLSLYHGFDLSTLEDRMDAAAA